MLVGGEVEEGLVGEGVEESWRVREWKKVGG